jgi:hypothetical protein
MPTTPYVCPFGSNSTTAYRICSVTRLPSTLWTPNSQPCKISYLSLLVLMVSSADSDSIKFGEFIAYVSCTVDPKAVQNRNITRLRIDFILIYFLKTPIPNASSKPKIAAIFALLLLWSIA